jgi:hypothetical protein
MIALVGVTWEYQGGLLRNGVLDWTTLSIRVCTVCNTITPIEEMNCLLVVLLFWPRFMIRKQSSHCVNQFYHPITAMTLGLFP